ncbi:MAG: hypothetical protein AAGF24_10150, partial [Cyanobacteria bacterium P01_H01_bin.121]
MYMQRLAIGTSALWLLTTSVFSVPVQAGGSTTGGVSPDSSTPAGHTFGPDNVLQPVTLPLLNLVLQAANNPTPTPTPAVGSDSDANQALDGFDATGGFDNETNQTVNQTNRTLGELDAALESFRIQNDGENFTIRVGSETLSLSSELVQAFLAIVTGETIGGTSPTAAIAAVRATLLNAGVPATEVNALITDLVGIRCVGVDDENDCGAGEPQASLIQPQSQFTQVQAIARLKATQLKATQLKATSLVNVEDIAQHQTLVLDSQLLAQNEVALDQIRILSVDPVKLAESIDAFNAIILSSDRATLEAIKADAELMFIRDTLNLLAEAVVNREVAARTTPNDVTPIVGAASTPAPRTTRPDVAIAEPAPSPYSEGLEAAGAANQMAQRAASFTDWGQVAATWQTAIDLMQQVPANSP